MLRIRLPVLFMACLTLACGGDDGPSGAGGVQFPAIDASVLGAFCWRSNQTVPASVGGTVSSGDCDSADVDPADEGYYETYRVRVASAQSVTFSIASTYDTYLTVVRVNSISGTTVNVTVIDEDDDSGTDLNAMLTVTLQPGVDYFVAVGGYDYTETGPYTLSIN